MTEPTAEERLDSWKEIGAYLKRDIRTLRRWEKNEGLPIHRHLHRKGSTVYAFRSEIDSWVQRRRPGEGKQSTSRTRAWWRRKKAIALMTGGVLLILAAAISWQAMESGSGTAVSAVAFEERDWILVAGFENRTGESVLDGTIEHLLEREMNASRFVNVIPRVRVNDTLQLMKRPLDTRVDAELGREICLRDGGIRALLSGRVDKVGSNYILSVDLTAPTTGVQVASFVEKADKENLLAAVRRISDSVREALGEQLLNAQESAPRLLKATTPSLAALHYYSIGSRVSAVPSTSNWEEGVELSRRALEEDPGFASAHVLMGTLLWALGRRRQAEVHFQRAFELAETASDRERYLILGTYHRDRLEWQEAERSFRALLRLYPDDIPGLEGLAAVYRHQGQFDRALPYTVRLADLLPRNFRANLYAGRDLLGSADPSRSEPYFDRLQDLETNDRWLEAHLPLVPAYREWLKGDMTAAFSEARRLEEATRAGDIPGRRRWLLRSLGYLYLTLGKLEAAQKTFQSLSWQATLSEVAFARGERQVIAGRLTSPTFRAVVFLAHLGRKETARELLSDPKISGSAWGPLLVEPWQQLAEGKLALLEGNSGEAIRLLTEALRHLQYWPTAYYFMGVQSLARAWEDQGDRRRAARALEQAAARKGVAIFCEGGFFWMETELQRAELYRKLGRREEADQIEEEVRKLLALADPDHAIARRLRSH